MKFNELEVFCNEGGGNSFSIDCPECGEWVDVSLGGSWVGSRADSQYCRNCESKIRIGGVVEE